MIDLRKCHITSGEYKHAQKVWQELRVKDMGDYTQIYNIQDTLLLLDSFNALRDVFMKQFGLDAAHFFSLPHLAWTCALHDTGAELKYMKDPTMHAWLESAKRGGVAAGGVLRAARANNPLLPPHLYKTEEPNRWLMALDLNNLYNVCMSSYLPIRDFKWMDDENDQDTEWHHLLNNPTQWIMAQRPDQDIGYT